MVSGDVHNLVCPRRGEVSVAKLSLDRELVVAGWDGSWCAYGRCR